MKISNDFAISIHIELKKLINEKSKRDQVKFTGSQLARSLNMPRSIITKLIHPNLSKRVLNPKIDTLLKIVEFFRADGFNLTVDTLLGRTNNCIDVQEQDTLIDAALQTISLFSFDSTKNNKLGTIDIKISNPSKNMIALFADQDIKPLFKKGSIFLIDQEMEPADNTLVAVKLNANKRIQIKKYLIERHQKILKAFNSDEKQIILTPSVWHEVIGVVVQINAKT